MMKPITSANFNKIVILQSLETGRTGNKLQDDLSTFKIYTDDIVTTDLIDVANKKDFLSSLSNIKDDVQHGKYRPIIHIETHGDKSGLMLASTESITWQDMKGPLSEINIEMRLNLFVCISACHGGYLANVLDTNDRAPCFALIGPKETMCANDLLKDYTNFYEEIFKTKSGSTAIKRLNNNLTGNHAKYYFTTAELFFEVVWINYLHKHCSNDNLNKRANDMRRQLKKNNLQDIPSRNAMKKKLLFTHPSHFIKSKETFFMMDLFEENRDRFSAEYEIIRKKSIGTQEIDLVDPAQATGR